MPVPPSGTVTLLFTDIEGSTRAWESHPVEMQRALARHDVLLRAVIETSGGYVFKTVGDAFCAAFTDSRSAVRASLAVQEAVALEPWPGLTPVGVRVAVHTGECEERDSDYFGPTVNRIARLLAIGHGGQILVSGVAAHLARDQLPESASLRDLGEHRLKDLGRPEHVFQLDSPGMVSSFPALRSLDNPRLSHNLPEQLTTFVGRDRELTELRSLLTSARLVTLTGPGGTGKTRLALQAAAEQLDGSADGVWLVDLSSLTDADRLAESVASVLSIREVPGCSTLVTLVDALRDQDRLLVLDNCEHVIDAAALVVEALLRSCPRLGVLATTREALGVGGEVVLRVPPLALPAADDAQLDDVAVSEAARLFVERVQLHTREFVLDVANAPTIARVCRRLDGIPLAIELAAARVQSLTVEEVDARLDQRFRLLVGGGRSARERQQTLRATVDWSYALLTPEEQHVFARVSVFAGGFDLDAAEAITSDRDIASFEVLDHLSALADKSLIVRDDRGPKSHYSMLETLHVYAADRLAEQGGHTVSASRARHRDYHLALAERAALHLHSPDQTAWLDVLDREHDNLRAALVFTLDEPDGAQTALRFVVALVDWWERATPSDWLVYATTALGRSDAADSTARRAVALQGVAGLHMQLGEIIAARAYLDEALAIAHEIGDERLAASVLYNQGYAWMLQLDLDQARTLLDKSLQLARQHGDTRTEVLAILRLGEVRSDQGDRNALDDLQEALTAARAMDDPELIAKLCMNCGAVQTEWGNPASAEPLLTEALTIYRELRHPYMVATNLSNLGFVALLRRDSATARALNLEALQLTRHTNNRSIQAFSLLGGAWTAFLTRDYARATNLYGASDAMTEHFEALDPPALRRTREMQLEKMRTVLGDAAFSEEYETGRRLSLPDAIALVDGIGKTQT
jgi:predicted ATPase/class 3 adenylate cyclase/Tfp pilus assembly protein PilF